MRSMNIGVIGAGFIGRQHIEAARRVPGVTVLALADTPEAARERADALCVPRAYGDWRELLRDPDIQVVHNCTPNALHDEINREALRAGKHVYCEKPLSTSPQGAREMLNLAERQGLAHGLNHQYRMNAAVREMRARVLSGACGRVLLVRGEYLQEAHSRATDYKQGMELAIGGPSRALADIGTHVVDTAETATGKRVASVMAVLDIVHPTRFRPNGEAYACRNEDIALLTVRFEDGTPGVFTVSKVSSGRKNHQFVSIDAQEYAMAWQQELPDKLWYGRRDQPNGDAFMVPAQLTEAARPYVTLPAGHVMGFNDALRNAVSAFYESIWDGSYREGDVPYATFRDGAHLMDVVAAAMRSSAEGKWVDV